MERTNGSKESTVERRLEKVALLVWVVCLVSWGTALQDLG